MRTKTLLLTAAVTAAGIATSAAQVFSQNAVGYINVTVGPGFQMIANQLDAGDNSIQALLSDVPQGSEIFKFNAATSSFESAIFLGQDALGAGQGWMDAATGGPSTMDLLPGQGAFFRNTTADEVTLTFVGEVPQGDLSHSVPANFSIQSSEVPQAGPIGELGFPTAQGDEAYLFNPSTQGYDSFIALDSSTWMNAATAATGDPTVDVGESFFVKKTADANWTRQFSVND